MPLGGSITSTHILGRRNIILLLNFICESSLFYLTLLIFVLRDRFLLGPKAFGRGPSKIRPLDTKINKVK
jgi:hypothetical protein